MWIPARASLATAATIAGLLGALASGPPASAAPSAAPAADRATGPAAVREQAVSAAAGCADVLGIAGRYGEFTAGDNRRGPGGRGAAGAVAVGGDAGFPGGSTVGRDLGAAEARALPGGNALIVAGDVTGGVRVLHGNGVHGGTLTGRAEAPAGTMTEGPSPVDFAAEFATLRRVSAGLAEAGRSSAAQWRTLGPMGLAGAERPTGSTGSSLRFTGTDVRYNTFVVPAAELEKAAEIRLAVPVGATTVITVEGAGYRQGAAGATRFLLWDEGEGREVTEGTSASAAGGVIRSKLLWNLPGATRVVKDGAAAWPGSILAPDADVDLGAGDGPVNGSVIARSLTGAGGAGTRHLPFSGCLPRVPAPVEPGAAAPGTPDPAGTGTGTGPPPADPPSVPPSEAAPGGSAAPGRAPTATPDGSAAPSASAGPRIEGQGGGPGGLARTGGGVVTVELAVGGGAVLATGTAMVLVARRRRA
ncbi:choice-of-anchor A family protein [Streptomyces sp. H27-S2]|uniref:choice-of-anchor A family protein n=1 Tax=Streptomyces antarcticus TaxID=2996458 RepID=UPI002271AC8D|nr:choice-of-anchor A family protein [Streptomyces sp. H27-S2]MCY0954465.1 choice-of-anchor A family protein [Streptomyces sp. H27-S2]